MKPRKSFYICLFIASILGLLPALYLEFTWFKTFIDKQLPIDIETAKTVKITSLNSILEVAIGVNLALSVIEQFANYMMSHFHNAVATLGEKNPTFAEAMKEAAAKAAADLGARLDQSHLQEKFSNHIESQKAQFNSDSKDFMRWVKALGFVTAFVFFWMLLNAGLADSAEIPRTFAHFVWIAAILPISMYLIGLLFLYFGYKNEVHNFNVAGQSQNYYKAFIQDTMEIYRAKVIDLRKAEELLKQTEKLTAKKK
jgi:hypothetical protein